MPRFRDGKAWPEAIAGANRDAAGRAMGTEAGYTIANARTIREASGGAAIGYCTDQNYADIVVLEHELKSYSVMFSMPTSSRSLASTWRNTSTCLIRSGL